MSVVPTLYVRNVPPELYEALKRWAEESGRSVSAEVLHVLERAAASRQGRSDWYESFLALRRELGLTNEDVDDAIAAIRAHRDAGM